jgi:short-subunit dehydrogenase
MNEIDNNGKTALMTGASSGIGCHLARVFAENGYDLVLAARDKVRLRAQVDELSGDHSVEVLALPADLPETNLAEKIFAWFEKRAQHFRFLTILGYDPFQRAFRGPSY